jgi:hypothetical protein|tara:strand:+ start:446 stop:691 length:246 start_codon:yes stop_codon:yes gene_type:complete
MEIKKGAGGRRDGAGRKSKADEQNLIEKLSPLEEEFHRQLKIALIDGKPWAMNMFASYMYGKPIETKDIKIQGEQPLFPID